jgi:hypothetical protein
MKTLINIIIVLLVCFSIPLLIISLFGISEYQTGYVGYKQKVEKRCQLLLAIRLQQVAPRKFVTYPFLLDSPDYQKGLLGYVIKDLIQRYEAGKGSTIHAFDVLQMRQYMKSNYNADAY